MGVCNLNNMLVRDRHVLSKCCSNFVSEPSTDMPSFARPPTVELGHVQVLAHTDCRDPVAGDLTLDGLGGCLVRSDGGRSVSEQYDLTLDVSAVTWGS